MDGELSRRSKKSKEYPISHVECVRAVPLCHFERDYSTLGGISLSLACLSCTVSPHIGGSGTCYWMFHIMDIRSASDETIGSIHLTVALVSWSSDSDQKNIIKSPT